MDLYASAPVPSFRLIASQFPPIGLFDTVATAADLEPVMELAGWTNDRLVVERLARLARTQWVYGRPNSSIVMAAYLHAPPGGLRFNGPDLGAWYAAKKISTALIEVAHHLRREAVARSLPTLQRSYRAYQATLLGRYLDIRGQKSARLDLYDPASYAASQTFGEEVRAAGGDGIVYDSLRHRGGENLVGYLPRHVTDVVQTDHFEVVVQAATPQIVARRLTG